MSPISINLSTSRVQRLKDIRALFSNHSGTDLSENWIGGRAEGLRRLQAIKPELYGKTRNYLNGEVTQLSPYLRYGCISLSEAIIFTKYKSASGSDKLLFEFAWRDYWRHIWYKTGERIHSEMEPPKVKLGRNPLPSAITELQTKLPCMDEFIETLKETGYLHNHARMWLSSYLIHWQKVDWRIASKWMHDLLLDGDEASNSLSWQWVASTFGNKPYFFNQENLSKYTLNQPCEKCKAVCPFKGSYESLDLTLFEPTTAPAKITPSSNTPVDIELIGSEHIILFHDEMLSQECPLYIKSQRKIFVFDEALYKDWDLKKLQFLADCLAEMPEVEIWLGDTLEVLKELNTGSVETQMTPNTALRKRLSACNVTYVEEQSIYLETTKQKLYSKGVVRFSKYWNEVGAEILKR
ncbi:MAG: DNA photolyase [Methylophilaceae bacterium]|nr:MAG: DNA photolyase [Methylophilaceae bacterium]